MLFIAQLLQNEWRKQCQPLILSHLLPANGRLKWSWALSRVTGHGPLAFVPLRTTPSSWQSVYVPPGTHLDMQTRTRSRVLERVDDPRRRQTRVNLVADMGEYSGLLNALRPTVLCNDKMSDAPSRS